MHQAVPQGPHELSPQDQTVLAFEPILPMS